MVRLTGSKRNRKGQAMIEGVCSTSLIIAVVVGGLLLILNTGMAVFYKQKLGYVAQAVSAYVQGKADWLGCTRPDYKPEKAHAEGTEVANILLEKLGMPKASHVDYEEFTVDGNRFVKVTVTVNQLRLPGGGCLPSAISMSETGVSVDNSGDCWGFAWVRFHEPERNRDRGMLLPVMAFCPNNTNFNSASPLACKIRGNNYNCAVQVLRGASVDTPVYMTYEKGGRSVVAP